MKLRPFHVLLVRSEAGNWKDDTWFLARTVVSFAISEGLRPWQTMRYDERAFSFMSHLVELDVWIGSLDY